MVNFSIHQKHIDFTLFGVACAVVSNNTANHGRPLILLKTHVVLVRVACASMLMPALYEKAQAPE